MSYEKVIDGLEACFQAVEGIKIVLRYEPTTVQDAPLMYMLFDEAPRTQTGQVTVMPYRILCRLCFRWQDNEKAELELIPFVNRVPAAIDAAPNLPIPTDPPTSAIASGMARVIAIVGGFTTIGDVLYRSIDFTVEAVDKGPFKGGI